MSVRRYLCGAAAVLFLAAGCGSSDSNSDKGTAGGDTSGDQQTVVVNVDADTSSAPVAFTAYFPKKVSVHPGDTVDFAENFTGEPHTVTLGTLVTEGLAKADPAAQDEPVELKKIPALLPDGPGDAIQAAAQPCFLPAGEDPPASDACSKAQQKQGEFTGTETYYNSGFLADGDHFKVTLAKDIAPGTYSYFCTLHRAGMSGEITVVAADQTAQTADEVAKAGEKELSTKLASLGTTLTAIKAGTLPPFLPTASPTSVIVGGGSQDVQDAVPVLFGPDSTSVKVGGKVTWTVLGPHTITFGSTEALRTFIAKAPDGAVHVNPDSFAPAGGAGQPQPDPNAPPPDENAPPGPPTPIDGGSYNGDGLHSSGLVLSFPPQLFSYSITFSKAGSYSYVCLIHPDMKGTVNVT